MSQVNAEASQAMIRRSPRVPVCEIELATQLPIDALAVIGYHGNSGYTLMQIVCFQIICTTMRVVVVGAGLAGPLLAQGLIRSGVEVVILEHRPSGEFRRTGYRIHLEPEGELALRSSLPPDLHQLTLLTAGKPGTGVRVLDTDLQVVHEMIVNQPADPQTEGQHLSVDRQTLREILLAGLEDVTRYGSGLDHYRLTGDGSVEAILDDGSRLPADLLVGADGAGSRVRQQLVPQMEVTELDQVNIFGRTLLTDETMSIVPPAALDGFSAVVGPDGRTMPLAAHRFANSPQPAADRIRPGLRLSASDDYLMWVFSTPTASLPRNHATAVLQNFVADQVARWHPNLPRIVQASLPGSVRSTAVRTSQRPNPWTSSPITLIGDAAHPMIPAGIGAATGLVDAARLAEQLTVQNHSQLLTDAVGSYEEQMLQYGFDAVHQSEKRNG